MLFLLSQYFAAPILKHLVSRPSNTVNHGPIYLPGNYTGLTGTNNT